MTNEKFLDLKEEIVDFLLDVAQEDTYCGDWAREILKNLKEDDLQTEE
jgi:hypothetical protein